VPYCIRPETPSFKGYLQTMTSRPRTNRIKLSWSQIDCRRCHDRRVVGMPCSICGASPDPREVDPNLQRRQRLARDALAILDRPSDGRAASRVVADKWSPEEGFDPLVEWLEQFVPTLNAAIRDPSAAPRLLELVTNLVDLRSQLHASRWLRPHLPVWRTTDTLIGHLDQVARCYLTACVEPLPRQAKAAAEAGQQALDAAADEKHRLDQRLERWQRISASDQAGDIVAALAVEAYRQAGTTDLLVLEQDGAQDFEQLLGAACPSGMGLLLRMMSLQAEVVLDEERFRRIARDAYAVFVGRSDQLLRLAQDQTLVDDIHDAVRRGYDAIVTAQAILAAARDDRRAIRAVLALAHELLEGPGKRYVAALLAVAGQRSYQALRRQDAGALLQQASQQPTLVPLLDGLDIALRHAKAHEDYLIEGDELILTDHGVRRLNTPAIPGLVLLDRVLTALETVQALFFALTAAAAAIDITLVDTVDYSHFDMAEEDVIAMLLAVQSSWTDVIVEFHGDTLRVAATGDLPAQPLRPVAVLVPHLLERVTRLELTVHTKTGHRLLTGPIEPWRRYNASVDWEKQLHFIECCGRWHVDRKPTFGQELIRRLAATLALEQAAAGYPVCVEPLRQLRDLARHLEDEELASGLGRLIAHVRNGSLDLADNAAGSDVVSRFRRWAQADVPVPEGLRSASATV
jgi:hypothetical protein